MAIQFKTFPKGSLIGSGAYKFRHYGQEQPASLPWLCFTAQIRNSTIKMAINGTPSKGQAFETSVDGTTWEKFIPGTTTITLANVGDKAYFRGDNTTFSETNKIYYKYVMTGKIAASGNVMSLIDKSCQRTDVPAYCYYRMFHECTSLTAAPELPATTLATYCYSWMFSDCTSLTAAPELPATTLATRCYSIMLARCTSLTAAPELPATTLVTYCYYGMFVGCTSLKVSETQDAIYTKPYRIPTIGTGIATGSSVLDNMFTDTGGSFTGTPTINKVYYIAEVI